MSKQRTSRIMVAMAHGNDGQVLLCEDSVALEFVRESGGGVSPCEGAFILSDCGVDIEPLPVPGVYVGELRIVDGGPESYEMPHIRDYYAEVRKLRPVTKEEWKSHLSGEWPEEWSVPASCPTCDGQGVYLVNAHGPQEMKCTDCGGTGNRQSTPPPAPSTDGPAAGSG